MATSETVEVLLATFNGERFLREQIESILAQDYLDLRVLARDDGSCDGTVEILTEYKRRFPDRVRLLPTIQPTGSAKGNFLTLMNASTANYVCFSDQDDFWLPDKVRVTKQAMHSLESQWGHSMPCLVFTDLRLVDSRLRTLRESFWDLMRINPGNMDRLNRLLSLSIVTGCTAMLNRPLLELAKRMPDEASMHDRWIGLLATTMGKSMAVKTQTVLYRQHGMNVVGTGQDLTRKATKKAKRSFWNRLRYVRNGAAFAQWKLAQEQAAAFLTIHGSELRFEMHRILKAFRKCEVDDRRLVRLLTLIRYGFYDVGLLPTLATIAIVWSSQGSRCIGEGSDPQN